MTGDKRLMLQAYLDNEFPVEEIIRFEKDLSNEERKRLEAENILEKAIIEKVNSNILCPDRLWTFVKKDLQDKKQLRVKGHFHKVFWPAAAIILLCVTLYMTMLSPYNQEVLQVTLPDNVEKFPEKAMIVGNRTKINRFLADNGFSLTIAERKKGHHSIEVKGASFIKDNKINGVKLFATCCNYPVTILIINKKGPTGNVTVHTPGNTYYQIARKTKIYKIIAVSEHNPEEVLTLF